MSKIKLPNPEELYAMLEKELEDQEVALTGDIEQFKKELYKDFKKYIKINEVDEFIVEDYIEDVIYDLVYDDTPHRVTDNFRPPSTSTDC